MAEDAQMAQACLAASSCSTELAELSVAISKDCVCRECLRGKEAPSPPELRTLHYSYIRSRKWDARRHLKLGPDICWFSGCVMHTPIPAKDGNISPAHSEGEKYPSPVLWVAFSL
ncbi:Hypothetical predicted protein [Podarcis lilfordi]|uniref:Uncharacterized protein n=1 Tax=Podarcis lilfordi TaxID=74358 RepID=A0AA35KWR4_9SAUR|nr:Hypothetical predicted protein [Podarcis lilfordi]